MTPVPTVLKPSQVKRLTKSGKLPEMIPGGQVFCLKCRRPHVGSSTVSPTFYNNGDYARCHHCQAVTLHGGLYPPVEGFPSGILVDTSGERKKYPMTLDDSQLS